MAEKLPPLPETLTVDNWHEGMTLGEWEGAAMHIVGWLSCADPELFARAVVSARETTDRDRARRAAREAVTR